MSQNFQDLNEDKNPSSMHAQSLSDTSDDDWELPGVACMLRPGMPGFEECEACQ